MFSKYHTYGPHKFTCGKCGENFADSLSLINHVKTHKETTKRAAEEKCESPPKRYKINDRVHKRKKRFSNLISQRTFFPEVWFYLSFYKENIVCFIGWGICCNYPSEN